MRYQVELSASIADVIEVEADSEDEARELANAEWCLDEALRNGYATSVDVHSVELIDEEDDNDY